MSNQPSYQEALDAAYEAVSEELGLARGDIRDSTPLGDETQRRNIEKSLRLKPGLDGIELPDSVRTAGDLVWYLRTQVAPLEN